ncbi:HEAT repeat domain-containing protein [Nocardia salmonicida]|uniref:HEAT repeat domain-containing protein n=1 Tax=Nocardia salmonicida TaxID=53431 RepID=UPI0037BD1967
MTPTDDTAATRLLADYRRVAGSTDTIAEIGNRLQNSPEVIAVLAQWLTELETRWPGPETQGRELARLYLANALNRRESRKTTAIPALISQFDHAKPASPRVRWAAGNALYNIPAGKEHFEQLAAIAADRGFGTDRQMVVDWLGKARHPDAAAVAVAQLDDDTVQGHALDALSRMRAQGVRKQVEPFLTSKFPWYRRNAERVLRYDKG